MSRSQDVAVADDDMKLNAWLGTIAEIAIGVALFNLHAATAGVRIAAIKLDGTPVTLYQPAGVRRGPVVVIAHGFAGSQQLMQSFALTFARNGYVAMTFDFPGHGRNARPLTGSISQLDGATRTLVSDLGTVARYARTIGNGQIAVLGHSMASDIVIRYAEANPDVAATIAVSMYSPAVTATEPRNLLVIVGDWEGPLKREALRVAGLVAGAVAGRPGTTYGDMSRGTGRRVEFSAHVEHASVLYSEDSMRAALAWLDAVFLFVRAEPPSLDERGPWILVLFSGIVLLGRPLAAWLPRQHDPGVGRRSGGGG